MKRESEASPVEEPTRPLGSTELSGERTPVGPGLFGDIEDQRLFEQIRARMFSPNAALRIGRYRILRRLGAGAMGEVQLAVDEQLDRSVAIKFVHPELASRRHAERLRLEARALARLAHPNVVHVYDVGEYRGRVYLAMEYIRGQSLREWIREHQPSWREVLAAYVDAGRGLLAAHSAGLVHRDFKPDNVLRGEDGRVAVVDFGLAAIEQDLEPSSSSSELTLGDAPERTTSLSRTGEVAGTPAYMPPEQFRGHGDSRADQFAFCVSLYEGLWGRRPFLRHELDDAIAGRVDWRPSPPPSGGEVPGWIWPLLRRGLASDPDARWTSLDELLAAIDARLQARRRRVWLLGSGLVAIAVGTMSAAAVGWWSASEAVDECSALEPELEQTWGADQRARLTELFATLAAEPGSAWWADAEVPVVAGLDRWRERWLASRRELCRERSGGDPVVLDRLGACLEAQRRSTRALVELLLVGDAETLRAAPQSVQELPDPRRCASEAKQGGPPEPPESIAAEVELVRGELDRLEAELSTGHADTVLRESESFVSRVEALEHAPLRAELLYLRGRALLTSRPDAGFELLEQAADLAEAARHDRLLADAWRFMAMSAATEHRDLERGRRWLRRADAAAARIGIEPLTAARLDFVRGNLLLLDGDSNAAVAQLEAALAVLVDQDDTLHAAHASSALGLALLGRGDDQRALELFEQSLELSRQVYGARHPEVAAAAYDLGQAALEAEREPLARRMLEQAVNIWAEAPSIDPLDTGRAQLALAQFAQLEGRNEAALELALAAARTFEMAPLAGPADHAEAAVTAAASYYFMGETELAISAYRQAVAGYTEAHGADDLYTAYFRVALGWALLAAGRVDEARGELEAGLAVITSEAGPEQSVDARFGLVAVDLATAKLASAQARLAELDRSTLTGFEPLELELFTGLLHHRLDPGDPRGAAALDRAREQARAIANGEVTLAILLDSVGASLDERRLAGE